MLGSHNQDCFPSDVAQPSPDYNKVSLMIMTRLSPDYNEVSLKIMTRAPAVACIDWNLATLLSLDGCCQLDQLASADVRTNNGSCQLLQPFNLAY